MVQDSVLDHHKYVRTVICWVIILSFSAVAVFAIAYGLFMSNDSDEQHFHSHTGKQLGATDAIYLSVLTQTTVGCSEPKPVSAVTKWLVAAQSVSTISILLGVVLIILDVPKETS